MTYSELLTLLDGFNPHQLDEPVCINLGGINQKGSYIFPGPNDFVYPVE